MIKALHLPQSIHASLKLAVKCRLALGIQPVTVKGEMAVESSLLVGRQVRGAEEDG